MQLVVNPADAGEADIPEERDIQRPGVIQDLQVPGQFLFHAFLTPDCVWLFYAFHGFSVLPQQRKQVKDSPLLQPEQVNTRIDCAVFSRNRFVDRRNERIVRLMFRFVRIQGTGIISSDTV